MNNEINIENIIEKIITWLKKIFERRFLLYKTTAVACVFDNQKTTPFAEMVFGRLNRREYRACQL